MIITNENHLPAPLVAAVSQMRPPDPTQLSVTELIGPPQIRILTERHWDEITEDASARIWAAVGTLMHQLLESHAGAERHQAERTLSAIVGGETVTGTFDLYHEDGVLSDYKFVSVWTTMRGVSFEWEAQLNLYAELLRRAGVLVERLQIVALYRDWTKNKAFEHGYPKSQVQVFKVPLWTSERATRFMAERIRLHRAADAGEVPECTPEERWARATKFALMKRGQKKAVKLYNTEREADDAVMKPEHYVERRPGASVRCESYCRVSAFCPQYARIKAESSDDDSEAIH